MKRGKKRILHKKHNSKHEKKLMHRIIRHIRGRKISRKEQAIKRKNVLKAKPISKERKPFIRYEQKILVYRVLMILLIVLLAAYIVFFSNIVKRDCGNDLTCFNNAAVRCSGAKVEILKEANTYAYTILGPLKSDCVIEVKLKSMPLGTPVDFIEKLEGKSMQCSIPRSLLKETKIENMDNLIDYCSGQLKESFYAVLTDKMYALIIKNMANITNAVEKDLLKLSQ